MLKGKAKTDYQRNYMRNRRLAAQNAGLTKKPVFSEIIPSQDTLQSTNSVRPDVLDPPEQIRPVRPELTKKEIREIKADIAVQEALGIPPTGIPKLGIPSVRTLSPHRSMSVPGICADGVEPHVDLLEVNKWCRQ